MANDKPSARQLRYLRALIDATGQTCAWPKTRSEASRAIARLKRAPTAPRSERDEDRRAVKDALASQTPASSVHESEIAGYGSPLPVAVTSDARAQHERSRGRPPGREEVAPAASMCGWAAGGLYLPSDDCAHAGHELTQMIRRSKSSRERDPELARLVAATAARDLPGFDPELVVSIAPTPGQEDRFRNIRRDVARRLGAADGGPVLSQTRVVADYRRLPIAERWLASRGRFTASEAVRGRAVLVIDDVVTSGAQAGDAIRALAEAGASALGFVAIARASAGPGGPVTRPRIAIRRLAERRDPLAARLPYDQADG